MKRSIKQKHLEYFQGMLTFTESNIVRCRIDYDCNSEMPLIVIDGKPLSWTEFGVMMMTYEGWQFRLEIVDPSGDL